MGKRILFFLITLLLLSTSFLHSQNYTNKHYVRKVFGQMENMGTMPKEKENLLLSLYPPQVKEKLLELQKLSENRYQKMLWNLVVYVPADYKNKNDELFNNVVVTDGPASPEQIKRDLLEIDVEILSIKIKSSDSQSSSQLKDQLISTLYQLFDYSMSGRQTRLQRLEDQLTELKNTISTLNKKRDEIVNTKLKDLLK